MPLSDTRARAGRRLDDEIALQPMLEQPLDDRPRDVRPPFETRLRRDRPRPAIRAAASARAPLLYRTVAPRLASTTSTNTCARRVEVVRRDRLMPLLLPSCEERSRRRSCTNSPCVRGSIDLFVLRLFLELEDVLREELERATQVGFERADRPHLRLGRPGLAVIRGRGGRRTFSAHHRPLGRSASSTRQQ